ncbi:hypothetical protein DCS_03078 [Drechmeria coniospora]|uniref:Reverse transcriptase Ty1/copia-type domain-containing protein n=1 Tax=Drechmeria coniospora TaxID=98403 RepID=A0A151GY21_DRECN|nr:hypothetical protein DCS_03078 [Drechmeria coniospora]KYK61933.1 hypothetical protein DCS_03078 [Drechmeria coniospora]
MLQQQYGFQLAIRDITQAYTQSNTPLHREILARPPREITERYPEGTIFRVMRPLYGIPEAGAHWFLTYQNHYRDKMEMDASSYDPCLMVSRSESKSIGIVGMQTDDTIQLGNTAFMEMEDQSLQQHKITAKPKTVLTNRSIKDFNGLQISIENVNATDPNRDQQYMQQRVRGAYLASLCQPEAAMDYSVAVQAQSPTDTDILALNRRIQWQLDYKDRGLRFIPLCTTDLKMFIFADGSFANNKDLTSQIGYIIVLANEMEHTNEQFKIQAIRQSYERREILEIRWINGSENPADAMTKVQPNRKLERLVSTNQIDIRIEGWVDRE